MFLSIQRILFATDFSESAQDAQQYAIALAERLGAELHLLHVVPFSVSTYELASPYSVLENETDSLTNIAQERLEGLIDPGAPGNLRIERAVVVGNIVDEILQYAEAHQIALIVVGTHGHTGLSRLLIGSVAEKNRSVGQVSRVNRSSQGPAVLDVMAAARWIASQLLLPRRRQNRWATLDHASQAERGV